MSQPFRFVHASDFHLERPLGGLAEVPAHMAPLLLDAPYSAATRVFDLAESERADFVVLAGDILDASRAGPRAVEFLLSQFERLSARGVGVYWVAGAAERRGPWPAEVKLPPGVHLFPPGPASVVTHHADGDDLAVVIGASIPEVPGAADQPRKKSKGGADAALEAQLRGIPNRATIGLAYDAAHVRGLGKSTVDYWACGGEHNRREFEHAGRTVICCGSPQGGAPAERGPHGALVVEVDEQHTARPRFVSTDVARYRRVGVELDPTCPQSENQRILAERIQAERARAPGHDLLLQWRIRLVGAAAMVPSREAFGQQWLRWLRQEFGADSPAAWSISVDVVAPRNSMPPRDGSLLADFLDALREFEASDADLPLTTLLPQGVQDALAARLLASDTPRTRQRLLRQVRDLGRELLAADEGAA